MQRTFEVRIRNKTESYCWNPAEVSKTTSGAQSFCKMAGSFANVSADRNDILDQQSCGRIAGPEMDGLGGSDPHSERMSVIERSVDATLAAQLELVAAHGRMDDMRMKQIEELEAPIKKRVDAMETSWPRSMSGRSSASLRRSAIGRRRQLPWLTFTT